MIAAFSREEPTTPASKVTREKMRVMMERIHAAKGNQRMLS